MEPAFWRDQLANVFRHQRVLFVGGVVAAWTHEVDVVRQLGAADVAILATEGLGAGELPADDAAHRFVLDCRNDNMIETIRATRALVGNLPAAARAFIDDFDPTLVLGSFLNEHATVAGHRFLAYRRPEWIALEDKVVVDALWDRACVTRSPSMVVPARHDALVDAHRQLDAGAGTVWAGDAREGFNGGASYTRWVTDPSTMQDAVDFLTAHCDRVRVMRYLEGIPCSIHGIVFDDDVIALRPVEMTIHTRPTPPRFNYSGCATFWDPRAGDRDEMRSIARRVGALLRDEVDFRGAFTVDGVMTVDGFRPTELNPRYGAGINTMMRTIEELPLLLLLDALVAGIELDWRPDDLEATIVSAADAHRAGGTWQFVPAALEPARGRTVTLVDGEFRWAADDDVVAGRVNISPPVDAGHAGVAGVAGCFVGCMLDADTTPIGPSVGTLTAAFWDFVDRDAGTSLGPLTPARSVR